MAAAPSTPDAPVVGIDLGMTSVVAAHVPGPGEVPELIGFERGAATLPAVVALPRAGHGAAVLGRSAVRAVTTDPPRAIWGLKRLLGRRFDSQAVKELRARVGFAIAGGPDGLAAVEIDGQRHGVPDLVAHLFAEVRRASERALERPVDRCVLAVPAYFTDEQRAAASSAAARGGWTVVRLLHEPTAAALAYGYNRGAASRVMVVDMGGARLDVTVLEVSGNVFEVVATGGDPFLGSADVDERVAAWILSGVERKHGRRLQDDPTLLAKVRAAAEEAKRELVRSRAVDLQIPLERRGDGERRPRLSQLRLRAETAHDLAAPIARRLRAVVERTLASRRLAARDIDEVLLVGGGLHLPALRQAVQAVVDRPTRASLPPEQVIALGAALVGDSLRRGTEEGPSVLNQTLSLALADGRLLPVVERETSLPVTRRVTVPTARDGQRSLELDLFEGEGEAPWDAVHLGTIVFGGLAPGPAGTGQLVVDISVETDRSIRIGSPEPGRSGETFVLRAEGHPRRKDGSPPEPTLEVAQGVPPPDLRG